MAASREHFNASKFEALVDQVQAVSSDHLPWNVAYGNVTTTYKRLYKEALENELFATTSDATFTKWLKNIGDTVIAIADDPKDAMLETTKLISKIKNSAALDATNYVDIFADLAEEYLKLKVCTPEMVLFSFSFTTIL
jgi:hypothetical protein